jgi:hypothetical protein
VPGLSINRDYDDGAKSGRKHLLAVRRLRRGLERLSAEDRAEPRRPMAVSSYDLAHELEELVAALDRRVPRVEQAGEAAIARDAEALRAKAMDRLAQLATNMAVPAASDPGDPK